MGDRNTLWTKRYNTIMSETLFIDNKYNHIATQKHQKGVNTGYVVENIASLKYSLSEKTFSGQVSFAVN